VFLDERREGRGVDREIGPAEGAGVVDWEPVADALHVEVVLALQVFHIAISSQNYCANRAFLVLPVLTAWLVLLLWDQLYPVAS
jgi:hypothetical protein